MRAGLVAGLALALAACGGKEPAPRQGKSLGPAVRVHTVAAARMDWSDDVEVTGTVRARQTGVVASRLMAYVREVGVRVGDTVRAGQVVVRLEARELDNAVRQAEAMDAEAHNAQAEVTQAVAAAHAQLDLAKATHQRMSDLFQRRSVTRQELDEATARLRMADAQVQGAIAKRNQVEARRKQAAEAVAAARIQRGYLEVSAPFAGRVIERNVEPGNLATPGQPLLHIEQAGVYRLETPVEESLLGAVRLGDRVPVWLEATGAEAQGRVVEIVPAVDAASRSFTVKLEVPGGAALRTGMSGKARFPRGKRQVLAVPTAAVRTEGSLRYVMTVPAGEARLRLVTLGAARDGAVEVLSGLSEGEMVVSSLPPSLADEDRVEVR
ncbi:MAG: efflux RND transporter periplasmic adaptor subunit [Bryobacterales bacterium]|nr:efflux RND transporter periplasmic adaptor subunit [Bryobacterales bacterium]